MAWYPTNANDVRLVISRVDEDGDLVKTGTTSIVVDDFSIDSEEDLQSLSGIGNRKPQGISKGDIDYSFSFTVQGEDEDTMLDLSEDGEAVELELKALFDSVTIVLEGAWAGTRSVSGSSGDPIEYEVEGMATNRRNEAQTEE